jgi:hypothetical protein
LGFGICGIYLISGVNTYAVCKIASLESLGTCGMVALIRVVRVVLMEVFMTSPVLEVIRLVGSRRRIFFCGVVGYARGGNLVSIVSIVSGVLKVRIRLCYSIGPQGLTDQRKDPPRDPLDLS